MKPPSGGPTTGAIRPGQVMSAMARTRSCFEAVRRTASRPTGDISAAAAPCSTRAEVNSKRLPANPQRIEAKVKTPIAAQKTLRTPKRSASHPLAGNDGAERKKVGGDADGERHGVGAERFRHRRQRDRDHRAVEILHEEGGGDDERDQPRMLFHARAIAGDRRCRDPVED